jgi:hypothetical protein
MLSGPLLAHTLPSILQTLVADYAATTHFVWADRREVSAAKTAKKLEGKKISWFGHKLRHIFLSKKWQL